MDAQRLIDRALQEIGAIPTGSHAQDSETEEAMDRAAWLFDQYSVDGLIQDKRSRQTHTFTERKLAYTVSATASLNPDIPFDLPPALEVLGYRAQTDTDPRQLDQVSIDALLRNQRRDGLEPYLFVVEKGDPATLRFEAPPSVGDELIVIGGIWLTVARENWQPDTNLMLPRGSHRPLLLGLAMELAPSYGKDIDLQTRRNTRKALNTLRSNHHEPQIVEFDPGLQTTGYRGLSRGY